MGVLGEQIRVTQRPAGIGATGRACGIVSIGAEIVLLDGLSTSVGLSVIGWLVGLGCSATTGVLLVRGLRRAGRRAPGPADWVTLGRAVLVGSVAALVADSFLGRGSLVALVTLSTAALLLDALDGPVARRSGTVSRLGARFDMEVDAFLILVLSVYVAPGFGSWVLAIGAARYANLVAGWVVPWLGGSVQPRFWRKVVAATQGIVLTVAAAGVVSHALVEIAIVVALLLLAESFGRDAWWLARQHAPRETIAVRRTRMTTATHG